MRQDKPKYDTGMMARSRSGMNCGRPCEKRRTARHGRRWKRLWGNSKKAVPKGTVFLTPVLTPLYLTKGVKI